MGNDEEKLDYVYDDDYNEYEKKNINSIEPRLRRKFNG